LVWAIAEYAKSKARASLYMMLDYTVRLRAR
jgi:hypothetical protein